MSYRKFLFLFGFSAEVIMSTSCAPPSGSHQEVEAPLDVTVSTDRDSRDIESIVSERCVRCHSSGELNWKDLGNLKRFAQSGVLIQVLKSRQMPFPGSPEAEGITEDERKFLSAWAERQLKNKGVAH